MFEKVAELLKIVARDFMRVYFQVGFQLVLCITMSVVIYVFKDVMSVNINIILEIFRVSSIFFVMISFYRGFRQDKNKTFYLEHLSQYEKEILRKAIDDNSQTIYIGFSDASANALVKKGLLGKGSSLVDGMQMIEGYPFIIPIKIFKKLIKGKDKYLSVGDKK